MSHPEREPLSAAERLVELEAIKQLKARYFRLMDTKEWLPFSQVFTDDVVVDVSHDNWAGFIRYHSLQLRVLSIARCEMPAS